MTFYPLKRVISRTDALIRAKALCRCVRKSFAGVRWLEGGEGRRLTWAEVDGEQA